MHLTDLTDVRARLERDRPWAAFSLADLHPPFADFAAWFGPPDSGSIVLLYRAFDPPLVVCHGSPDDCEAGLADVRATLGGSGDVYLSVQQALLPLVAARFRSFERQPMVRMLLDVDRFRPVRSERVARLGPDDLVSVLDLYREAQPAFFLPMQLRDGVYFGVREGARLVAIAGTHVVSAVAQVGALGNVHTMGNRRRQGLAAAVTSAVVEELLTRGVATVVLNIVASNTAARRVYERIGFAEYCAYYEGLASPLPPGFMYDTPPSYLPGLPERSRRVR